MFWYDIYIVVPDGLLDALVGGGVHGSRSLVQHQDLGLPKQMTIVIILYLFNYSYQFLSINLKKEIKKGKR